MAGRRKAVSKTAEKLAEALTFVSVATGDLHDWAEHGRTINGQIVTSNGLLTAGFPIEEPLSCCPHIGRLISALNRAGKTLQLTEQGNGRLLVAGDRLKALVPCMPPESMPPILPDVRVATIDDRLKDGFKALLPLAAEEGQSIMETSILLQANSMVSTNKQVIFEYWHGIDLPPRLPIPKAAAAAVVKTAIALEGFGFTPDRSVTFYFEGGAWLKTQLYADEWAKNIDAILNTVGYPADLPKAFFEGVEAVADFSPDGGVHLHEDKIKSDYSAFGGSDGPVTGASYEVPGVQAGHSFTAKLLKLIKPVCDQMDYTTHADKATFVGCVDPTTKQPLLRGVLMKRVSNVG